MEELLDSNIKLYFPSWEEAGFPHLQLSALKVS